MRFLYLFGVQFYGFIIRIASLFNPKAKDWIDGRKNLFSTFPSTENKEVIWFHCASLGEFDQGLPLMELIRAQQPNVFLLVTFFSPSGFNHFHKRKHTADFVCYLPLDSPSNATKFIAHFKPKQTFFVKYEFWSNYIFELKKQGSKIYSISTLLRPEHRFFSWYGGYFRKTLKQFDYFFVQNEETKRLLKSIEITNALVTGDTRFDRVIENKKQLVANPILEQFIGTSKSVLICGSTWEMDENVLFPIINDSRFEKVIIAPHNIDELHIKSIGDGLKIPFVRYTHFTETADAKILILDTIGQLASAYSYGSIAYIGGGFSGSLHNILEPAVFGLPVIFGPKHKRFPEGQAFINEGFGFSISTSDELNGALEKINESRLVISKTEVAFIEKQSGASQKILEAISTH